MASTARYTARPWPTTPDTSAFTSLVDLLDDAARRYPARPAHAQPAHGRGHRPCLVRRGAAATGAARGVAAARRGPRARRPAADLEPVHARACPPCSGAPRCAGVVLVPLDLRMAPAVLQRIADRAGARVPGPRHRRRTRPTRRPPGSTGLELILALDDLTADPVQDDRTFPADWEAQLDAWPRPTRGSLFEVIYTSGTTSAAQGRDAHPRQHARDGRGVRPARCRRASIGWCRCCPSRTCSSRRRC